MKKIAFVAVIALLAIAGSVVVFKAASSSDSSSRKAAIGSGTPAATDASITSASLVGGAPIKVSDWSWGGDNTTSIQLGGTGGATAGKVNLHDFSIAKNIDNSSTTIFKFLTTGQPIASLTFKQGAALTYTFTNVFITSQDQDGAGGTEGNEKVTFTYAKFTMANAAAGQSPTVGYDVAAGKGY
jgi:type VI protein secretion system component Hcp